MIETDLVDAACGAVFAAITAAHAASGASVVDQPEQDQDPPFVMLDEIVWENTGSKRDPVLKITIDIVTVYRGTDRQQLLHLMHINFAALNDVAIAAAGVALTSPALSAGAISGLPADGITYAGTQTFEIYAEPA